MASGINIFRKQKLKSLQRRKVDYAYITQQKLQK